MTLLLAFLLMFTLVAVGGFFLGRWYEREFR